MQPTSHFETCACNIWKVVYYSLHKTQANCFVQDVFLLKLSVSYSFIFKSKNPSLATLFTNRALCYLKLKKWDLACHDCRRALELDNNLVKGYYFLGQALLEQQAYDESIGCLKKGIII